MATIFFGVNGEGLGHASRTLATVDRLPEHECHLFTYGKAYHFLRDLGYAPLHRIDGLTFAYTGGRVSYLRTGLATARFCMAGLWRNLRAIDALADRHRPQVYVSDLEPSVPRAGRRRGRPVLSVDNQHRLAFADTVRLPRFLRCYGVVCGAAAEAMVPRPTHTVVSTFHYDLIRRRRNRVTLTNGLLPKQALATTPTNGGYVLVYLRPSVSERVLTAVADLLQAAPSAAERFVVYGAADTPARRRLEGHPAVEFRPFGPNFTAVVAGADCVVSTGGCQLLTEARHFGKPLLVVPEPGQYEQWINAHYAVRLRMGELCPAERVTGERLRRFLQSRDEYRHPPAEEDGAATVADLIRRYTGTHPEGAAPEVDRKAE